MGGPPRVGRAIGLAAAGVVLGVAALAVASRLLERALRGGPPPVASVAAPTEGEIPGLDDLLQAELGRVGASLAASPGPDGVEIVRVPPRTTPRALGEALRRAARAVDIELYAAPLEGDEVEVRVYAGKRLARRLLLRASQAALLPAPDVPTLRERPLVAVVVTDLGDQPPGDLLTLDVPLTLAITPFSPYSLRLAEDARLTWHEVLVDLEGAEPPEAQLRAVPGASGVLREDPAEALPAFDAAAISVVVDDTPSPPEPPPHARVASTTRLPGAPATELLALAWTTAREQGRALVVLSATDPTFPDAILGLRKAQALGYRVALASEIARWEDVRGLPHERSEAARAARGRGR